MNKNAVLVISDNHNDPLYFSLIPDKEKCKIVPPGTSLDYVHHDRPDLVLLDCGPNAEKGIECLRRIKEYTNAVPVIFLTDVRSDEIAVRAYKLGVRDYYRKPVDVVQLRKNIAHLLKLKRNSREKREHLHYISGNTSAGTSALSSEIPINIMRAVLYIENNLPSIRTLDHIASTANMSKYHFVRRFKQLTGFSPMAFVSQLKIHKAKELLNRKDLPISIVAEEAGYNSLKNFGYQFKQNTGVTPTAYRKHLKSS